MSSTCSRDMVNFGPLTVGHPCKFQRISCLGSVTCTASSSGRQLNFAALNRGRHVCSAGRPSRWALAHILVFILCYFVHDFYAVSHQILVTQMTALHNFFDFKNYKKNRICANTELDIRPRGAVSTAAMSSSDRLTRKTHPYNHIPSRWLSYSRRYIDSNVYRPTPCLNGTTDLRRGW